MTGAAKKDLQPHIGLAVLTVGVMALGLAIGLKWLGLLSGVDGLLLTAFSPAAIKPPEKMLEPIWLWAATTLLAFALPAVILNVPGHWRRLIVWGGTITLTVSWGPVLVLAARIPEIGVALVVVIWSGFCAMFYTLNHVLPVDVLESEIETKKHNAKS